jgi:hypothetical protein
MKKNIIIYGLIAGIVVSIPMLFTAISINNAAGSIDFNKGMLIGYASMLIAFSLVYVGIRNYRNNFNAGTISFGKAFKIGMLIVLIASTLYVATWLIAYFYFIPDFADKFSAHTLAELKANGASQVEIDKEAKDMANFATMYKNPFFNAMITYMEILPVGLLVTLISALLLKKKPGRKEPYPMGTVGEAIMANK